MTAAHPDPSENAQVGAEAREILANNTIMALLIEPPFNMGSLSLGFRVTEIGNCQFGLKCWPFSRGAVLFDLTL